MSEPQYYRGYEYNVAKGKAKFYIYSMLCKGCGLCIVKCPVNKQGKDCLRWSKHLGIYLNPMVEPEESLCIGCGTCAETCPDSAIRVDRIK